MLDPLYQGIKKHGNTPWYNHVIGYSTITDHGPELPCYGKCSKISNTFLVLFSNEMLVIRDGIHKLLVRIANREDPDQTASSEAV